MSPFLPHSALLGNPNQTQRLGRQSGIIISEPASHPSAYFELGLVGIKLWFSEPNSPSETLTKGHPKKMILGNQLLIYICNEGPTCS